MKTKAKFNPVAEVKVNDTTKIVLSEMTYEGEKIGFYVNNFINSEKYQGPSKGLFIPAAQMKEFKSIIEKA